MPLPREAEFYVNLILQATPISKTPYRIAPVELKELKIQQDEFLEKGYMRPTTSPWGAYTLCEEEGWDLEVVHGLEGVQ